MKFEEREVPDAWEELSQRQFQYFLKQFCNKLLAGKCSKTDLLIDFADFCIGRPKSFTKPIALHYKLVTAEIATIIGQWIFVEEDGEVVINYNTTENLIPEIGKLRGPMSHGADLRFGEFRAAVEHFNSYTTSHDEIELNYLVGILYRRQSKDIRKKDFDGNFRIKFNQHHTHLYARAAAEIPYHLRYGIYLWFAFFCKYLISGVFIIEGREISFADIFKSGEEDDAPKYDIGMKSILFTMADTGTFGNARDTDNELLFDILQKLIHDQNAIEALKKYQSTPTSND